MTVAHAFRSTERQRFMRLYRVSNLRTGSSILAAGALPNDDSGILRLPIMMRIAKKGTGLGSQM
jgi:hypothetical protein